MDGDREFNLHWGGEVVVKHDPGTVSHEEVYQSVLDNDHSSSFGNMTESIIENTDQMAAENLMFLAQDVVGYTAELAEDPNVECVTEEVITDDWVISGGQERVEVPLEHLTNPVQDVVEDNDIDVPLPTDQDEYTAMRPWPCDFCSRRFRKKAALMNHMVAHQSDRPHACNLCGVRYVRKCDLINHLKVHAYVPDDADSHDIEMLEKSQITRPKKKRGRRKKIPEPEEDSWENMRSARTQQWSRRGARVPSPRAPPEPLSPEPPSPPPREPSPPPVVTDPARPFVCKHCGIGFAREKALQSHSRVHGGDSPVECGECGELCWSRSALDAHSASKHPHLPATARALMQGDSDSDDDMEFRLSPESVRSEGGVPERGRVGGEGSRGAGPELFCSECGVAFQRGDLLRRHVAAAHSYKRYSSQHACEVCGERCEDALQLLAHAELHADTHHTHRSKKISRGRNNTTTSSSSRQFPCRECGKVFGSRSSQQIHIRIHTGERPYACRFCWKAFADGGTLRKHERIHTGEKPYACAVCPRAFNQRVVLREHVRSHHSGPNRPNGGALYGCVVCGRTLTSSAELASHLIQHCDANTALKRQPQTGPRKYKRRRRMKTDVSPVRRSWPSRSPSSSPSPPPRSPSPPPTPSPCPSPSPAPLTRRKRRRMIHTEEKTHTKQMRPRRPPRHPADDLRAIGGHRSLKREVSTPQREVSPVKSEASPPKLQASSIKNEASSPSREVDEGGPYKCEMCSEEFPRRDALLLHVPVHI